MNKDQIQRELEAYYRRTFSNHQNARVFEITELTEGWESIIYAYKLAVDPQTGSQPQSLILRLYPGTNAHQKSMREFEGMQVLYRLGYPVPQVYHLEGEDSPFEKPFVLMEFVEGDLMWSLFGRSGPERRRELIAQLCELQIALHNLDWQPFVSQDNRRAIEQNTYIFVDCWLAEVRELMKSFPALVAFSPVMDWLEARRDAVPCNRPAPIHWDFHANNLIVRRDGTAVVIDWTQIQISDPRFDLGWTLLLMGAYEGKRVRNLILQEYERINGAKVDQLEFFDVANCLKRLGTVFLSLAVGADQMGMRPEAVEGMRRDFPALQRAYDLLVQRCGINIPVVEELLSS
jgi:aminoglycoside phosphotransferase (APT) family kinase protein